MKKVTLILVGFICFAGMMPAQSKEKKQRQSFAKKGDNTVNLYYGASLTNLLIKGVASISATDIRFNSLGPMGLMYERIIKDDIGLGAELSYNAVDFSYSDVYTDPVTNIREDYTVNLKFNTIRAMARLNFHLLDEGKNDFYLFVSGGYRKTTATLSATIPQDKVSVNLPSLSGFAFKPGFGYRYFFVKDAVGLNMEFALGAPFASAGLTFKFR